MLSRILAAEVCSMVMSKIVNCSKAYKEYKDLQNLWLYDP